MRDGDVMAIFLCDDDLRRQSPLSAQEAEEEAETLQIMNNKIWKMINQNHGSSSDIMNTDRSEGTDSKGQNGSLDVCERYDHIDQITDQHASCSILTCFRHSSSPEDELSELTRRADYRMVLLYIHLS